MKVTLTRLRSNVTYTGFNNHTLDPFFYSYEKWMKTRSDIDFQTYNVSFDKNIKPKRTLIESDYWVIPSEAEFRYHGELQMNPKDLAKSESHMDEIRPYFEGKTVIMWRSDRGDTEDLYRDETFRGINLKAFYTIDEIDFSGNIHGMKYHFIQTLKNPLAVFVGQERTKDFGYWGRMKPSEKNEREKTIRQIYRSELSTVLIGGFPSGVQRESAWIKDWKVLYPKLEVCRSTLCFNWLDTTATTSRYPEALSIGMIPFVWKDYDETNTYRIDDWQRVYSFDEFRDRVLELRDKSVFESKLEKYRSNYKKVLLSREEYLNQFSKFMNRVVHDA